MGERLHRIAAEGFRGLPRTSLDVNSKNLCVLGGNGKGKSAVVDAIEFALSGTVSRLTGAGTGGIRLEDALQNVRTQRTPSATLVFRPSRASVTREIGSARAVHPPSAALLRHLEEHPAPSRCILRRGALLEFIRAADADRHKMFVRLIGLERLDLVQRTMREARDRAESNSGSALVARLGQLEAFRTLGATTAPSTAANVLLTLNSLLGRLGLAQLGSWDHLEDRIQCVGLLRSNESAERLNRLNAAINSLTEFLPDDLDALAASINEAVLAIVHLEAGHEDAARVPTLAAAASYLRSHPTAITCPVCERAFPDSREGIVDQLATRLAAQAEVAHHRGQLQNAWLRLRERLAYAVTALNRDIAACGALSDTPFEQLTSARDAASVLLASLHARPPAAATAGTAIPAAIIDAIGPRRALCADLVAQRASLIPGEAGLVEECNRLLRLARERLPDLLRNDERVRETGQTLARAIVAQDALAAARDAAVQSIMDRIAEKVLTYYSAIHAISPEDRPECNAVRFNLTGRAERGSTRLVVTFLGKADCDPKGYLSDGHLDSLGLCIFLACVRMFNPEGTLLVLDDILTSVDREHRHRVADLLFAEFAAYQIILTTHDGYWAEQLKAAARATGVEGEWLFLEIRGWTPDVGPEFGDVSASEGYIRENLTESQFRELGGALRAVLEDFVRKCGARLEIRTRFKLDGRYTAGDLLNSGFADGLRSKLAQAQSGNAGAWEREMQQCLFVPLTNVLAHGDDRRLESTLTEVEDFFSGLVALRSRARAERLYP